MYPSPRSVNFTYSIRDLSSELPRTSPTPNETAAKGSHDTNRALVHDFVNIIPQVTEGREEEDLAEQITLAHRRYIVAASAEFKKLVFSGEQSETVSTFHYMTSGTTPPSESRFIRSLRSTVRHRNPTPQLRRDPNTIGLMTDIKSRRRMAIWDDGAVARQLDAKLRNGVPSEVWI